MTLISCVCYVVTWEVLYFHSMPDFADKYAAHMAEQLKVSGASAARIQAKVEEMQRFKQCMRIRW